MVVALLLGCSGSGVLHFDGGPRDAVVLGRTPRNVLVVSLDTTRRDRLDFFGEHDTTPSLDALFSDGVILEDHRSCSNWTAPSAYCAQSGNFQLDEGVWPTALNPNERDTRVPWPPAEAPTLASILTGAGFETTLVTTNSMFSSLMVGGGYGFQTEVRLLAQNGGPVTDAALMEAKRLVANGKPWYFHVHFLDPHESYDAPQSYWSDPDLGCPWDVSIVEVQRRLAGGDLWTGLDEKGRAQARACLFNVYEGELRSWDEELERLWVELDRDGLLDDTLVVFWTDHGQSFGEHDDQFNHGKTLYDTENRATAAFWAKDIVRGRWTGPTTHEDLAPTILKALDVPLGRHSGIVVGHASEDRVRVSFDYLVGYSIPLISAVQEDRKLMYAWDGTKHLYDLRSDVDEEVDLYDPSDPDVVRLWETLQPIVERTDEVWPGLKPVKVGP
jgi:arylsulfatase A-like enzyme